MGLKIRVNLSEAFHNKVNTTGNQGAYGSSFHPFEVTIPELIQHIRAGKAFTLCSFMGHSRKKDQFVSGQLLGLDLDEGTHTIKDLLKIAFIKDNAFLLYPTPSSTPDTPKSRVLFVLDEPVTDLAEWEALQLRLLERFADLKPDPACKDAARLFFGSDLPGGAKGEDKVLSIAKVSNLQRQEIGGVSVITAAAPPSPNGELPPEFISTIEGQLKIGGYNSDGFSAAIPCIFKNHEHDHTHPAAAWHRDNHFFKCFKCGETWNAKETGAQLGIELSDYLTKSNGKKNGKGDDDGDDDTAPQGFKPTDDELGDQLMEKWSGRVRYLYGSWHKYQNGFWTPWELMALDFWEVMKRNKPLGIRPTNSKASSIEGYLRLMCYVPDEEIGESYNYINLENGLFNLDTLELEPHRPELYMTYQLPFSYDSDATCPTFTRFIHEVLVTPDHKTDYDLRDMIQEAMGYSLTADTSYRVSFWLVGESGAGKSRFLEVLIDLAGNSHTTIDLDEMQRNSYQIADIAGKRIVTFTEPSSNSVLADAHYKRLVSQDVIMARQIHGKPFRFVPVCKLWGAMNDTPRVVDRSDAVFNRVLIIPFNYVVPKEKRDPELGAKMRAELPGIFNWALRGLARLRANGKFTRAKQSEQAREEYKNENDTEGAFVEDWCKRDPNARVSATEFYEAYALWCQRNGVRAKSSVKVSKDWKRLGFQKIKSSQNYYLGVEINTPAKKFIHGV